MHKLDFWNLLKNTSVRISNCTCAISAFLHMFYNISFEKVIEWKSQQIIFQKKLIIRKFLKMVPGDYQRTNLIGLLTNYLRYHQLQWIVLLHVPETLAHKEFAN